MFAPACIYYWLHVFSVYMLFSNANLCWWFCCLLPSLDAGATPSVGFCSCARVFAKKTQLFFFQRVRVTSQSCDSEIESDGRCAAACSEYKAPAFSKPLKGFLLLVK